MTIARRARGVVAQLLTFLKSLKSLKFQYGKRLETRGTPRTKIAHEGESLPPC